MTINNSTFNVWQDALENEKKRQRELVQPLIDKYGWPLDENKMELDDSLMYDYIRPYVQRMEKEMSTLKNRELYSNLEEEENFDLELEKDDMDLGVDLTLDKRSGKKVQLAENMQKTSQKDCEPTPTAPRQEESEEERLLRKIGKHLKAEGVGEGARPYIYLDTKGNITIGNGANIDDEKTFMSLNWTYDNKRPATKEEIKEAYQIFLEAKAMGEFGQKYTADYYKNKSNLRISKDYADELMYKHLKNDIARLNKHLPRFNEAPEPLKMVLLDIRYNTGNITEKNWPHLWNGLREKNLTKILKNIDRGDISAGRRKAMKELLQSVPLKDGWHW